jgi:hypothetical protein
MIDKRCIELMNREIDGVNSSTESAELRRFLESSEEARTYYRELGNLVEMFGTAGAVQTPKNLERIILSRIEEREAERSAISEGVLSRHIFSPRRKLALAFAAGIAVGLIVLVALYRSFPGAFSPDIASLYGTLADRTPVGSALSVRTVPIELPDVSGELTVTYLEKAVLADISLTAGTETEILLTPAQRLPLDGFRSRAPIDYAMTSTDGSIGITVKGNCGYLLGFKDEHRIHPPIEIKIIANGKVVFDRTVRSGRESRG